MKTYPIPFAFLLFLFFNLNSNAQLKTEWIISQQSGGHLVWDGENHIYTIGKITADTDVDPSVDSVILSLNSSYSHFIQKLDLNENLIWSFPMAKSSSNYLFFGNSIVDNDKNLIAHAYFHDTLFLTFNNLDTSIVSFSSTDCILLKISPQGNLIWLQHVEGAGSNLYSDITVDSNNNIYCVGSFTNTVDLHPSIDSSLYFTNSNGWDLFYQQFTPNGQFLWSKVCGGNSVSNPRSIALDTNNNIYVCGNFNGTGDFDPSQSTFNMTSTGGDDVFIQKLDSAGNLIWVKSLGISTINEDVDEIIVDNNNDIVLSGKFGNTFNASPSGIGIWLTSIGQYDNFISKFDAQGNGIWGYSWGGTGHDQPYNLNIDSKNNIYSVGRFEGNVDFDYGLGTDIRISNGSADIYLLKISPTGNFNYVQTYGSNQFDFVSSIEVTDNSEIILMTNSASNWVDFSIGSDTLITSTLNNFYHILKLREKGVYGSVFHDINLNCIQNQSENRLANRNVLISPGNIVAQTNQFGTWNVDSLPNGVYNLTVDSSGNWEATCSFYGSFTVTQSDSITHAPSLGLISTQPCVDPDISINMPFIRPCLSNQKIYVQSCNNHIATGILDSTYVIINLDTLITPISSSIPYTDLGNNQLQFEVGTLYPGQCVNFNISTTVSCNAILGQTLCLEGNLHPKDSCVFDTIPEPYMGGVAPCNTSWDKSSLQIEGYCQNDSICFIVTNTGSFGSGDMSCYAPVRLYIDGQLISLDSIQLLGGESISLCYSGDGRTWRMEVDQHPLHPGNSHPNAVVELCGDANNWTPDLVNIQPMDDADPVVDIFCGVVKGSYDSNDKTGFPTGITEEHDIRSNQQLEYMIRFQNTGADTAFIVVIRDTLDTNFNIFSVQSGASSHNYNFTMHGPRVLEWTFNNILLPDSTTDEVGSHGFVMFKVNQHPNLPQGTQILNDADIYFDFNAPIITNETVHTINDSIDILIPTINISITDTICDQYNYNGLTYSQSGTYWQYIENTNGDSLVTINVLVKQSTEYTFSQTECYSYTFNGITYDSTGIYEQFYINSVGCDSIITINLAITIDTTLTQSGIILQSNDIGATFQWINCDSNSVLIGETNQSFTPTVNGNYAVQLSENGCIDTSACYLINSVGLLESTFDNNLIIYPNPTNGLLKIELGENFTEISIQVIDIDGRIVLSKQFITRSKFNLDLTSLANGIYIVKLKADDKNAVLRVVKEE